MGWVRFCIRFFNTFKGLCRKEIPKREEMETEIWVE